MSHFIILHDMVDPNDKQGRSYKQVNAEKTHNIPIGALVEDRTGVRLFVVLQTRDCDQTPLYSLATSIEASDRKWSHGYDEDELTVIKQP
jgi:hypothetical protein